MRVRTTAVVTAPVTRHEAAYHRVDEGFRSFPPYACLCGAVLPPVNSTGRPRLTCTPHCGRRRDHLLRMARRRVEWLAAWHLEEREQNYPRAQVRREVAQLQAELLEVLASLHGIHASLGGGAQSEAH